MKALDVLSPGFLSSIQDLGHPGLTHLGVSPGGSADPMALKIGNRLVGNRDGAAGIEMTLIGGTFRFREDAWIALTGGACSPHVDGQPAIMWYSFPVRRGQTLTIGKIGPGARCYLCIHGGVEASLLLGSRSTFFSGPWGGMSGRELRGGDVIERANDDREAPVFRRAGIVLRSLYRNVEKLRVTRGPQWDWFASESRQQFLQVPFEITSEANRRGVRLAGASLNRERAGELLTEGIANGAIQVTTDGQPIILYCEQQTTGGYPKIAHVARADWFKVGQLRPGEKVTFEEVSLQEAWSLNEQMEEQCATAIYRV